MSAPPSTVEVRVRYAETDQMGVAYHANYLVWCDIGRTEYIRSHGANYRDLEKQGVVLAVAEANVRYMASSHYDDLVRIETALVEIGSRRLIFDYILTNAETQERLATARTVLVSIDGSGRAKMLPRTVRELLAGEVDRPAQR